MQKITPCLWFDHLAEEAVRFYVSVFRKAKIGSTSYYDEASAKASGRPVGSVLTVSFELDGQEFLALNGGPVFSFTPAISFVVNCRDQQEVDRYWEALSDGGEKSMCGWLTDRYGMSWQVVPTVLNRMLLDKDPAKAARVMKAMLLMTKIEIAGLERAYKG